MSKVDTGKVQIEICDEIRTEEHKGALASARLNCKTSKVDVEKVQIKTCDRIRTREHKGELG